MKKLKICLDLDDCIYNGMNPSKFKEELEELEFYSLLKKIDFSGVEEKKEKKEEEWEEHLQSQSIEHKCTI